jgi:hypothetical protein
VKVPVHNAKAPPSHYRIKYLAYDIMDCSLKLEVIAYADHPSVTAAAMNFNLSKSMVSRWKASKNALSKHL